MKTRYLLHYLYIPILAQILNLLDNNSALSIKIADLLHSVYKKYTLEDARIQRPLGDGYDPPTFDHNALWSVARSGNHWVRFIAEHLTGHPTQGTKPKDPPIYLNTFPSDDHPLAHVDPKKPFILYKSHEAYPLTSGSSVLLLIRDYHEYLALLGIKEEKAEGYIAEIFHFLEMLARYDSFDGTKMIVYYEDLLEHPVQEIYRIKDFLGASEESYQNFLAHHDDYAQLSKQGENRDWRGHHSGGDFKFYQKQLSAKEMQIRKKVFNAMISTKRYQCVKPYIARYG